MMGRKQKLNGSEQDGLTRAKRFHKFKAGVRKLLKRAVNKRMRKGDKEVDINEDNEYGTSCPFCGKWIDDMTPHEAQDIYEEHKDEHLDYCPIHMKSFSR